MVSQGLYFQQCFYQHFLLLTQGAFIVSKLFFLSNGHGQCEDGRAILIVSLGLINYFLISNACVMRGLGTMIYSTNYISPIMGIDILVI